MIIDYKVSEGLNLKSALSRSQKAEKKLENRKEVNNMNYLCKAQSYLKSVAVTINSLAGIVMSYEMQGNFESQFKVVRTLIQLEQDTADFIIGMELDAELPQLTRIVKQKFININDRLIKHLEKIQLQGYNFSELISTLKLENETLKRECNFL